MEEVCSEISLIKPDLRDGSDVEHRVEQSHADDLIFEKVHSPGLKVEILIIFIVIIFIISNKVSESV